VTAQPTVSLATNATAGDGIISVATGIEEAVTSVNVKDEVKAITSVTVDAPNVTLSAQTTNETGAVVVDTVDTTGTQEVGFTGTAAAQTWTQSAGTTKAPNG
jgi:hypothetical protein